MAFFNGSSGSVTFGGNAFHVESWSGDFEIELLEVTTTGSNNFKETINGCKSGSGNFKSWFDATTVPIGGTPGFYPGAVGAAILTIGSSGKTITGTIRIKKINVENAAKAAVTFASDFEFTGSYIFPS